MKPPTFPPVFRIPQARDQGLTPAVKRDVPAKVTPDNGIFRRHCLQTGFPAGSGGSQRTGGLWAQKLDAAIREGKAAAMISAFKTIATK
jgi:hypothetical protein